MERVDIAQAYVDHKNPHPSHASKKFAKPSGKGIRTPSVTSCFVRKSFGSLMPDDFNEYIDDRCQAVAASSVDREVDIFSAVCNLAIDTWRVPVGKNPMDGVRRPKYFNERDRRLKADEEKRLLDAAYEEDAQQSIELRLDELMCEERAAACQSPTTYQRKNIVKAARIKYLEAAQASYTHIPLMETFIQFQLMTGARRSEALSLTLNNIDFGNQTAFIPETKNGRPRKLPLRKDTLMASALKEIHPEIGADIEVKVAAAGSDKEKARVLFSGMFDRPKGTTNVKKGRFAQALAHSISKSKDDVELPA